MSRTLLRQWVASCPALWASMHIPPVNPVRTRHGFDMLSHEATSLIYFGLVPTILASEYLLL